MAATPLLASQQRCELAIFFRLRKSPKTCDFGAAILCITTVCYRPEIRYAVSARHELRAGIGAMVGRHRDVRHGSVEWRIPCTFWRGEPVQRCSNFAMKDAGHADELRTSSCSAKEATFPLGTPPRATCCSPAHRPTCATSTSRGG